MQVEHAMLLDLSAKVTMATLQVAILKQSKDLATKATNAIVAKVLIDSLTTLESELEALKASAAEAIGLWCTEAEQKSYKVEAGSVSPSTTASVKIPYLPVDMPIDKNPEYRAFMGAIGDELKKPNYPAICLYVQQELANGKKIPTWVREVMLKYSLVCRPSAALRSLGLVDPPVAAIQQSTSKQGVPSDDIPF